MAKAKRLPSGSWRARVFSYKDKDGKMHYESFTAPTRIEAEMKAASFAAEKHRRARHDLTVGEALDGYIAAKTAVLSPSTISGYVRMRNVRYAGIEDKRLRVLTGEDMQLFVSGMAMEVSPKTVRNAYSLLSAAIAMYSPELSFKVTFPAKIRKRPVSPSDEQIRALIEAAPPKMKLNISLAVCGLRRGEICALKHEDIENGVAHVHADIVRDKDGKWIYKDTPKTVDSDRYVKLPENVLERIGEGSGYVAGMNPDTLTTQFCHLRDKLGYNFPFHSIRHYFASTAAILQIPDIYTADMGGWRRGGSIMKTVYQNNIASMSAYYADKMAGHINEVIGS